MKFKIKDINGNYVWLDTETGRTTPIEPTQLSNQSVNQANQQARQTVKVRQDTPKTVGEGKARTNARHRQNGTTPDTDYTQRQITAATAPTWRTDVADVLHGIGEGLMASTPITATSYFGAKALDDVIHGNANANTAMDIAFAAAPWLKPFRAASVATTANLMNEAGNWGMLILNDLYDPYTSFSARLGYYSNNPIANYWSTLARRFNLPDKARLPELIRKSKAKDIQIVGNEVLISRPATHHRATNVEFKDITNFTYDRPVVSHSGGNWDGAKATFVVNPKRVLEKGTFGGIEPSDAFLIDNGHLTLPLKDVTVISGDVETLNSARKLGMKTLSSKRARQLYESEQKKIAESEAKRLADIDEAIKNNADKHTIFDLKTKRPYSGDFSEYAKEIERLQGLRGRPFMKDVKLFENSTGLNAGVASISYKLPFMNLVSSFMNNTLNVKAPSYPNGRTFKPKDPVNVGSYKYIFYDPSTHAEALYRKSLSK